jgi:hypothetical protein
MLRPGTDWENNAPRVLCESLAALTSESVGTLVRTRIPGPWGSVIGSIIAAITNPAFIYALCGNYETTSPPLSGENRLPESNLTFSLQAERTIKVEVYKPPKQLSEEISRKVYSDDDTTTPRPGFTSFPLYKAISARESIRNRKFGCILYQPVSDEPLKLSKCNIQRPSSNLEEQDKQRLLDFVVRQKSTTLAMGAAIMSTINQGKVTTGVVIGPYTLSATAAAYAAFNKQMYSAPITKVPKGVEYESCTIPPPSIDAPLSIRKDTSAKLEPFIEITSPLAGVSN